MTPKKQGEPARGAGKVQQPQEGFCSDMETALRLNTSGLVYSAGAGTTGAAMSKGGPANYALATSDMMATGPAIYQPPRSGNKKKRGITGAKAAGSIMTANMSNLVYPRTVSGQAQFQKAQLHFENKYRISESHAVGHDARLTPMSSSLPANRQKETPTTDLGGPDGLPYAQSKTNFKIYTKKSINKKPQKARGVSGLVMNSPGIDSHHKSI